MSILALEQVDKLLKDYGKDAIESMNLELDRIGAENLQKSMRQFIEKEGNASVLTVAMSDYAEYIDRDTTYERDLFPPPQAISDWCDRKGLGIKGNGIKDDPKEFNSWTYGVSKKIFDNGIKGKPFLHLFEDLFPWYEDLFAKALKKDTLNSLD